MESNYQPQTRHLFKARQAESLLKEKSIKQVAKKIKIGTDTLRKWVKYYGWKIIKTTKSVISQQAGNQPAGSQSARSQQARQLKAEKKAARYAQVVEMLAAGMQQKQIAETLGYANSTVSEWIKDFGLKPARPDMAPIRQSKPAGPDMAALRMDAQQMYEDWGWNQKEIAAELKISPATIGKWAKQGKWKSRVQTWAKLPWSARYLYKKGMQQKQIAVKLQVHENTVNSWKKRYQWQTPKYENTTQKQARQFYEKQGLQQKQIALKLTISKNTVNAWKKRFNWIKPGKKAI